MNCTAREDFPDDPDFPIDPEIFTQCDKFGSIVPVEGKKMERYMHRYWANFMKTGNPNNESQQKGGFELILGLGKIKEKRKPMKVNLLQNLFP